MMFMSKGTVSRVPSYYVFWVICLQKFIWIWYKIRNFVKFWVHNLLIVLVENKPLGLICVHPEDSTLAMYPFVYFWQTVSIQNTEFIKIGFLLSRSILVCFQDVSQRGELYSVRRRPGRLFCTVPYMHENCLNTISCINSLSAFQAKIQCRKRLFFYKLKYIIFLT